MRLDPITVVHCASVFAPDTTQPLYFFLPWCHAAARRPSMPDDHSPLDPPLPIPNRTVKRRHADDSVDYPCESRSSSGTPQAPKPNPRLGFFACRMDPKAMLRRLLISNDLTYSGAPIALLALAQALKRLGENPIVLPLHGRPLAQAFHDSRIGLSRGMRPVPHFVRRREHRACRAAGIAVEVDCQASTVSRIAGKPWVWQIGRRFESADRAATGVRRREGRPAACTAMRTSNAVA